MWRAQWALENKWDTELTISPHLRPFEHLDKIQGIYLKEYQRRAVTGC